MPGFGVKLVHAGFLPEIVLLELGEALRERFMARNVNFLPPEAEWSGDLRSHEPDPARWIVFIDGEEVARTGDKSALSRIVTAHIAQGPGEDPGPALTL